MRTRRCGVICHCAACGEVGHNVRTCKADFGTVMAYLDEQARVRAEYEASALFRRAERIRKQREKIKAYWRDVPDDDPRKVRTRAAASHAMLTFWNDPDNEAKQREARAKMRETAKKNWADPLTRLRRLKGRAAAMSRRKKARAA